MYQYNDEDLKLLVKTKVVELADALLIKLNDSDFSKETRIRYNFLQNDRFAVKEIIIQLKLQ